MKRMLSWTSGAALFVIGLSNLAAYALPREPQEHGVKVDFVKDIQPILKANCYECHGEAKQKGRLRLDSKTLAFQGGKGGKAIVANKADDSLLMQRLTSPDEGERMPPEKPALPKEQIALIKAWIDQGAVWPESASNKDAKVEKHWVFIKPSRPEIPAVTRAEWVKTPIDAFILSRLEKENISPSKEAPKEVLIRRVYFDLVGLPPTPEEIDAFVADVSPDAYEKLVEKLLASSHYGERWARHWLDLARYAESEGFKADETRPNAWRYRDYVINSLNADKPYDRFIQEQIAGDEMFPEDLDAQIATGFNRHYPDESNARNLWQRRQEILHDITDVVGSVFMGLTVACARCHDHKYDEITQRDYYRLQAFFANVRADDRIPLLSAKELAEYNAKLAAWEEKTKDIRDEMAKIEAPRRETVLQELIEKYPKEIQAALFMPAEQRTPMDTLMYHKARLYTDPESHQFVAPQATVAGQLKGEAKERWTALKKQLDEFESIHPGPLPMATGIRDAGVASPETVTLKNGNWDAPKEKVEPGFMSAVIGSHDPAPVIPTSTSTGRRTALAKWLSSSENPLTARVMVNRIWHHHFGRGIVDTPSDLGIQGGKPTHPELLDWLATEFVARGWSMKEMHRLMVNSATYRQSSVLDSSLITHDSSLKIDPDNKLLWHFPRQRLEGEVIRDSALAAAGLLNPKMAGPSIFPELPPGMESRGGWKVNKEAGERNRRSIYIFVRRNTRYPMMEAFDMPDTHESCARRYNTVTPLQALTLLNNKLPLEWAQSLAGRVLEVAGNDRKQQITQAYRLSMGRKPTQAELDRIESFFDRHAEIVKDRVAKKEPLALPAAHADKVTKAEAATLVDLCHMLINTNEFVYRN